MTNNIRWNCLAVPFLPPLPHPLPAAPAQSLHPPPIFGPSNFDSFIYRQLNFNRISLWPKMPPLGHVLQLLWPATLLPPPCLLCPSIVKCPFAYLSFQLRNFCALWLLFCSLVIQFICNARKFVVKVKRFLSHFAFCFCSISGRAYWSSLRLKRPQASLRGLNASFKLLTSDPRERETQRGGETVSAWQDLEQAVYAWPLIKD